MTKFHDDHFVVRTWRGNLASLAGLLLAVLLCLVTIGRPYSNSPDIRSDGVGYHAWVHAIARGDISFCRYEPLLASVGAISGKSDDGTRCRNKYPPGVGLIQLPFSMLVLAGDPATTGFSPGENRVVLWGGSVMLFATAVLTYQVLRRRLVPVRTSLAIVAALMFGTGLFHYATYDASFSHVYSAFGVSLLAWIVLDRPRLRLAHLTAFALVAAWLYLVRQTNAALSLAVLYIAIQQVTRQSRWHIAVAWLTGTASAATLLLCYGRYVNGATSLSSYGDEGFPSFGGHSLDVLFSYERGLFTYYPVLLLVCLIALANLRRATSHVLLGLVAIFTLLYGSWHAWHLGAGFGHRGFVELAPFAMLAMADGLVRMDTRSRKVSFATAAVCCLATTLSMAAYWRGDLPIFGADESQYWRSISPVSIFAHPPYKYSKRAVRNISLTFLGASKGPDGQWQARVLVKNGNIITTLHGTDSLYLPLRMSWRVAESGTGLKTGWYSRQDLPALEPGESAALSVIVPAPASPAEQMNLQFTVVQETAFWAYKVGTMPLTVPWSATESDTN